MSDTLDAWWFAASDTLPHGDGRKVVVGETLKVDPPIALCKHGLHASIDPFDALRYVPGPLLYKVRLAGEIVHDGDKCAATERTALDCRDTTEMLPRFARKMALSVIHLWDAPAIVREYLETGDETKREAAWDAARAVAAAWDFAAACDTAPAWDASAAWDAAWAAAWAASPARDAVRAVAAAWAAARAVARTVARTVAAAPAWDASAAWAAARTMFNEMVEELFR